MIASRLRDARWAYFDRENLRRQRLAYICRSLRCRARAQLRLFFDELDDDITPMASHLLLSVCHGHATPIRVMIVADAEVPSRASHFISARAHQYPAAGALLTIFLPTSASRRQHIGIYLQNAAPLSFAAQTHTFRPAIGD